MSATGNGPFTVGDWLVEPELDQITRGSRKICLRSQVMELLVYLAKRNGRVVSAEDLLDKLWAGKVVASGTVYNCVAELRHALADGDGKHAYIETIPKKGYRLVAPVAGLGDSPDPTGGSRRNLFFAVMALVAAAAAYLALDSSVFEQSPPDTAGVPTHDAAQADGRVMLVVLPLENLSGDPGQEYFSDGLTEELIAYLGSLQRERLGVIARTSAMYYKGKDKRVDEIGRELGVHYLLEGSVRRFDDWVRITLQLIQVNNQAQLWSQSFDRDVDDIFALQEEVARRVGRTLELELLPAEQARLRRTRPANFEAHEAFLKGRYYDRRNDRESLVKAIGHYERAIGADPAYALAYAALAHVWHTLGWAEFIPVIEGNQKAWDYTTKAAEIDPNLAEVQVLFAEFRFWQYWDWAGAEEGFRLAFESAPGSEMAVWHYAICLRNLGRFDEAIAIAERGLEINPHSRWINDILSISLRNSRRFEQAIEKQLKIIEIVPKDASYHRRLGELYEDVGRYDEAVNVYLKERILEADSAEQVQALHTAYLEHGTGGYWRKHLEQLVESNEQIPPLELASIYSRLDRKDKELAWVQDLIGAIQPDHAMPFNFARVYVLLGDKERAFTWLEKAFEQRSLRLVGLKVSTTWDPLRDDPRFENLLQRMGFPD